jgi:hypothetical protein
VLPSPLHLANLLSLTHRTQNTPTDSTSKANRPLFPILMTVLAYEQEPPDEEDQPHDPADMTNKKKAGMRDMRGVLECRRACADSGFLILLVFYSVFKVFEWCFRNTMNKTCPLRH